MRDDSYSLSKQERETLDEKMRELLAFCQIHRIPMFVSCAVANDDEHTEYLNIVYSAQAHMLRLKDDRIRQHMLIANGSHEAVLKRENVTFDPFGVISRQQPHE